jgi:type I restriction enzyme S subunit
MNADRLLAQFERISEAPDAIARLRRFILDLAVRGKLVDQDPEDEPAEELFCQYLERRMDLASQGKIRRPKPSSPIRDEETPINLPVGWAWVRLNEIGSLSGGMTPSMVRPDYWDGHITWLSPKDIKSDEVIESELRLSELGLSESRLELYPPGCLFIVARSGILKRTLPVSINRVPAAANQDMKVLSPYVDGQERYLQVMLRGLTDYILRSLVKTGTTVQSLKYGEFAEQPFPIPPLAEQHRIVAKVDELMALCDQLEEARHLRQQGRERLVAATLQRLNQPAADPASFRKDASFALQVLPSLTTTPAQIKQLRQTILNLAVRGKLVEQDPEDEPLLSSGIFLKLQGQSPKRSKRGRTSSTASLDMERYQQVLPVGWASFRLADLVAQDRPISYGVLVPGDDVPNGVPFVRAQDLALDGHPSKPGKSISPDVERACSRTRLLGGEILICVVGSIGKLGIAPAEWAGANIARAVARIAPISDSMKGYLLLVLRSSLAQSFFLEATRTLAQPTLNIGLLEEIPIPLPPLAEQHRIVAMVDELMALCDQLEQQLNQGDQQRRRLLEAVLAEALQSSKPALGSESRV